MILAAADARDAAWAGPQVQLMLAALGEPQLWLVHVMPADPGCS